MESESSLTIKEMATRSGLSVHTPRYYERIGLIAHYRQIEHSLAPDQPIEGKQHATRTLRQRTRQA